MKGYGTLILLVAAAAILAIVWPRSEPAKVERVRGRIEQTDSVRTDVTVTYTERRRRYRAIADTTEGGPVEAAADSALAAADTVIRVDSLAITLRDSLTALMVPRPRRIQGIVHPKYDPIAQGFVLDLGAQLNLRPNVAVTAELELQKNAPVARALVGVRVLF